MHFFLQPKTIEAPDPANTFALLLHHLQHLQHRVDFLCRNRGPASILRVGIFIQSLLNERITFTCV